MNHAEQEAMMHPGLGAIRTVCAAVALAGLLAAEQARGASWADALFSETAHDFGPVPRGAKLRHNFLLANRLSEPINIIDVRASCGCTTGRALASFVPPGGSAIVEAEMDTRNFVGRKTTVLYVNLMTASGRRAEASLGVGSTILSDIVLNPGTIDFGAIMRGSPTTISLTIDRLGKPDWRIERMVSSSRAIEATLVERARNGQAVGYLLQVTPRADAPIGALRDEIRILTNDRDSPMFPIQVTGLIRGDLTASPSVLSLGTIASSGSVQGRFLARASRPFKIVEIAGDGDGFKATIDDPSAKPIHVVTITFSPEATSLRGDVKRQFRVVTDLEGEPPLELQASLTVSP